MASFLDLSLDLRRRVYAHTALLRLCPIELNLPYRYNQRVSSSPGACLYAWRKTGGDISLHLDEPECICPKLPLQLLLISRAIYQEVFFFLYSQNKFVLRVHDTKSFMSLRLDQHIIKTLTSLLIRLNSWPCPRGHNRSYPRDSQCWTCHTPTEESDLPLDISTQAGQALLIGWRTFADNLASSISPSLQLTIICDVSNKTSGRAVLEPLLRFPNIKRCTIRLGRHFDYELNELARKTSLRTQGSFIQTFGTFPFERLPKEIRLEILKYTHLGCHNSYSKIDRLLRIEGNKLVKGNVLSVHDKQICCRECTETLVDCCCIPTYAAYSSTCKCRQIPFGLSLVNREMRNNVMEVLLSQNSFDFLQDPQKTIKFLSNLPQGTLKYIRRLQLRVSEDEIQRWNESSYCEKFTNLAIFIRDNFCLEGLSIKVIIESWDLVCWVGSIEDTRFIYDVYCDITGALALLYALEDIQFELGCFAKLEPVMKRAILGQQHPKCPPKGPVSSGESGLLWELPTWYQESHFIRS